VALNTINQTKPISGSSNKLLVIYANISDHGTNPDVQFRQDSSLINNNNNNNTNTLFYEGKLNQDSV
jgi:hypothetical protein